MDSSPLPLSASDQSVFLSLSSDMASSSVDLTLTSVNQKHKNPEELKHTAEKGNVLHRSPDQANSSGKTASVSTQNKSTQAVKASTKKSVQWVRVSKENPSTSSSHQQVSNSSSSSSSSTTTTTTKENKVGVSANDGLQEVVGISSSSSYNEVLADKTAQGNAVSNSGNHGLKESAELSSSEEVLLDTSLCNEETETLCNSESKEFEASRSKETHHECPSLEESPQTLESHSSTSVHCQTHIVGGDEEEQEESENIPTILISDEVQSAEQQQSLSRSSSLNAKAREFIPGEFTSKNTKVSSSMPVMIPLGSSPGILSAFPSPTQMASFSIQMPLLGSPHIGLMSVQIPPMPPPQSMIIHPTASNVVVMHPTHPHHQIGPLLDSFVNQPSATIVAEVDNNVQGEVQQESDEVVSAPSVAEPLKPVLNEELRAKIVKQVEFYFSDANLPTDNHLMKFVKKDADGFVPISIVANFRKIKHLTKNHGLVALALRTSKELVVSEDGKKVRRLYPLPHIDIEEIQSRTVVAENLPDDHSIESMEKLFGSVGNVKMIRVCEPEAANSANQNANKFVKSDLVVSNKLHALVEYDSIEQAEKAVSILTDQRNWRSGLHVRLLLRRTFQNKHVHQASGGSKAPKVTEGGDGSGGEEDTITANESNIEKSVEDSHTDEHIGNDNTEGPGKRERRRGRGGRGRGRGNLFHSNGGRGQTVGTPPQSSSLLTTEMKPPPGPRMPDGTRGFSLGRGKPLTN